MQGRCAITLLVATTVLAVTWEVLRRWKDRQAPSSAILPRAKGWNILTICRRSGISRYKWAVELTIHEYAVSILYAWLGNIVYP